jgi:hypothetical protein
VAYVRTVRTASGATAVQIVHSTRRGSRDIEHLGSAHDESELEALKVAAQQRMAAGQAELDLGLDAAVGSGPLEIVSSRMSHLWDALCRGYDTLGFTDATGGDESFRDLVLARIIEPTSKLDSLRVLGEVGTDTVSYGTLARRLPAYAELSWRRGSPRRARSMPRWDRPPSSSTTSRRCTSRPMLGTGSASPGIRKSDGWTRRSPSGCSPTRPGSR